MPPRSWSRKRVARRYQEKSCALASSRNSNVNNGDEGSLEEDEQTTLPSAVIHVGLHHLTPTFDEELGGEGDELEEGVDSLIDRQLSDAPGKAKEHGLAVEEEEEEEEEEEGRG